METIRDKKYLVGSLFCFVSSAIASSEPGIYAVLSELNSRPEPVKHQKDRRRVGGKSAVYSIDQYPGYILKIDWGIQIEYTLPGHFLRLLAWNTCLFQKCSR